MEELRLECRMSHLLSKDVELIHGCRHTLKAHTDTQACMHIHTAHTQTQTHTHAHATAKKVWSLVILTTVLVLVVSVVSMSGWRFL